ncbi:MAG: hypothetical protein H0W74_11710 [Sphingosinicella sp.]|nr:hypothetical protein [Sphingosinicella sp.]
MASPPAAKSPGKLPAGTLPRKPGMNEDIVIVTPSGGERRLTLRTHVKAPTVPPPLPLFTDLLELSSTHVFGKDRRCQVSGDDGKPHLRCRPGASVSGIRLLFDPFRLPRGAPIDLHVTASGDPGFRAEVTGVDADANRPLAVKQGTGSLRLPDLPGYAPPQLVIMAPPEGGELVVNRLELITATSRPVIAFSAWAWEPSLWRTNPAGLVASANARKIGRLFVTLEVDDGEVLHRDDLRRFVRMARRAGLEIEAVEGDPRMVLPGGLEAALARANAFADYQRNAAGAEKLAGIQYDVEPYVLAEWGEGAATYEGWAHAILKLSKAAGEPIDLVLPFWVSGSSEGQSFLRRISPAARGLTIMSYRTKPSSLAQIAEPLLAWGAAEAKPVRLALEAGPIADEVEQVYREAAIGTLAVLPGPEARIVMLEKPGEIEGARMFALQGREIVRGDRISFFGDEEKMMELALRTSAAFSAWPTFAGFALHGLDWTISAGGSPGVP